MDKNEIANKMILIKEVVAKLRHFSKLYGIKSIFIAGGYCRSYYMGEMWTVNDIDVASAFKDQALQLGGLFASEILIEPSSNTCSTNKQPVSIRAFTPG